MSMITCPACKKEIDIARETTPTCPMCMHSFGDLPQIKHKEQKQLLVDAALLDVRKQADSISISFPWRRSASVIFAALFINIVGFIGVAAELNGANADLPPSRQGGTFAIVLFCMIVFIGLVCTYIALTGLFNKTNISCSSDTILISCTPFPWPLYLNRVDRSSLKLLYVKKHGLYTQRSMGKEEIVYRYTLMGLTHANHTIEIIRGLDTYARAVTLEAFLEQQLDLLDEIVPQEMESS